MDAQTYRNLLRLAAYGVRVAPARALDPSDFTRRFLAGARLQSLPWPWPARREAAALVIPLRRRRRG
jgi:hypothetical protein